MKRLTTKEFIKKSKEIHGGKYNYSKTEYVNYRTKVKIICPIHGEFIQGVNNHILNKSGCIHCSNDDHKMTTEKYIEKALQVHGNKYGYDDVKYINDKTNVKIKCKKHGIFYQRPYNHLSNHGCPKCNESKGEKEIRKVLDKYKIIYRTQKTFDGCKHKRKLKFDFYLPDHNICIEFDGEQHFKETKYYGGIKFLEDIINKDKIKNKYCKDNNIKLIRIKYDKFNKIEEIIKNEVVYLIYNTKCMRNL